jgi:uncharacterized protein
MNLQKKLIYLQGIIAGHAPLLIAYSGGIDSALLAVLTLETIGPEKMHCILVDGPELPRRDLAEARSIAETMGLPLTVVTGHPLDDDLMRENPHDRCRHCKLGIFHLLSDAAMRFSCSSIADGANASDLGEHRPGISAFSSCGVIHPFIMASITKTDIREIARTKNLPFWNKPSSACLYSRIPYGEEITAEKLRMVEQAEDLLIILGFRQVRVRHHGNIARIEILSEEFSKLLFHAGKIDKKLHDIGFSYVTLDLRGYRSGSMDEVLPGDTIPTQ